MYIVTVTETFSHYVRSVLMFAKSKDEIREYFKKQSNSERNFHVIAIQTVQMLEDIGTLEDAPGPRCINLMEEEELHAYLPSPILGRS